MSKITIIGAGSKFNRGFLPDIFLRPELEEVTLSLMDIDQDILDVMTALAKKMATQMNRSTKIESTTDRRRALDGADYVIMVARAHDFEAFDRQLRIGRKYGVYQSIGCTTGTGGVFRFLWEAPFNVSICRDMEELCPDAWFLTYANPTTTVPWVLNTVTKIRTVGMCHSVWGTARRLAGYIGAPFEETGHWVAGPNHMAWFLKFEWKGEDAYPLLWEKMKDPEIYKQDMVRFELMRRFGYFLTESSPHNSEYVPYFRKNPELIERWTPGWPHGSYNLKRWEKRIAKDREELRREAYGDEPVEMAPATEYPTWMIYAMETNNPCRVNGNVMNTGLITNLPQGSCVEVPCLVDNTGVHPCYVGDLPPQCAALNRQRMAGDELMVKGLLERDRRAIEQAVALDPLTAAMLTLDEIHAMVEECFEALSEYIPEFSQ